MHRPPAVSFQVVRSRCHLGFILASALLAAVNLAFWAQAQHSNHSISMVFATLVLVVVLALRAWWSAPTGRLGWDGESWFWSGFGDAALTRLAMVVDLQAATLVQIRGEPGQCVWLWLECRSFDARWLALRRALVART